MEKAKKLHTDRVFSAYSYQCAGFLLKFYYFPNYAPGSLQSAQSLLPVYYYPKERKPVPS